MRALLVVLFSLSGCAPFVEYEHVSLPNIDDDGLDLVCGGVVAGEALTVSGSLCENIRGGTYGEINVRYTWE